MPRIKLQLSDGIKRVVTLDTEATKGATLGTDVFLPSGAVATPTTMLAWLGATPSNNSSGSGSTNYGPGSNGDIFKLIGGIGQWSSPAALTKTDDTNVTLTLGGSASSALVNAASITVGWNGELSAPRGGTGYGSYTAGDILYASATNALSKLSIGSAGQYMGVSGIAPAWVNPGSLSKTDDTNVTLTLGGAPASALLQSVSLTLGWAGTLAKSRGGFGLDASTLTGYMKAAGAGAITASSTIPYSDISGAPSVPTLDSGTYTPTLTNVSNIVSPTAYSCQYFRIGNVVTVSGKLTLHTSGSPGAINISLPVSSNFSAEEQCAGTAAALTTALNCGAIYADTSADAALLQINATIPSTVTVMFTFTYLVI